MKHTTIKHTFFKYVSFNIIGMIGLSCYILADTFFIAQGIGADGLTALNLAIPIYSFISGVGLMIGMGAATRFSISKSDKIFTQAIYYTAIAACIFLVAGIFMPVKLAEMLGADISTLTNTSIYLRVILCFSPMFLLNNVTICFIRNDGNPRLAMTAMLAGSFSNIILDYIFVFPLKMGMFGAALATGIAPIISLLILSLHFMKKRNSFKLINSSLKVREMTDISSLGASSLITELSSGIVIIAFNFIILRLGGNVAVAAYGIVANISLVVIAVFAGISQGMQPIISSLHSSKDSYGARKVLKYGVFTSLSISLAIYVIATVFSSEIVAAFNRDGDIVLTQTAINGLLIYFTAFFFVGINLLCATYFSAIDSPKNGFIISILRGFIIIIPAAFILSNLFGINGVWSAIVVTESMVLIVCIKMLCSSKTST